MRRWTWRVDRGGEAGGVAECIRFSGFGLAGRPVPSIVVTTSPPSAHTGRRQELIARCSGRFCFRSIATGSRCTRRSRPGRTGFFGPASATPGEREVVDQQKVGRGVAMVTDRPLRKNDTE